MVAEWLALPTLGPFGDKSLDLSKTIFDISLSSSAFTKTVVKIKCLFMQANSECPDQMCVRVRLFVPSIVAPYATVM